MVARTLKLPDPQAPEEARSPSPSRALGAFFYPILIVGSTTALAYFIHRQVQVTILPLVMVAAMVSAWKWGLWGGIWGTVLSWFGYLFFFIPPILTFYIRDMESAARMSELVVSSVIVLVLTVGLERSRQRVQSQHQQLREVLRQLPSGVLIVESRSGQVILANNQVEKIWGRSVPSPMTMADYVRWTGFHADGRAYEVSERPFVRALSKGETVLGEEYDIVREDGSRATLQVNAAPIRNSSGAIVEGVVTFQEVTDRRRVEQGLRFLAQAGVVLTTSLELESVLRGLTKVALPHLGSWCAISLLEGGRESLQIHKAATSAVHPADAVLLEDIERRFPLDPGSSRGAAKVIRTGEAVLLSEVTDDALAGMSQSPQHLELLRRLNIKSWMGVPLTIRGITRGVLVLATSGTGRRYDSVDFDLAKALAERAVLAMENARLYRAAEREIQERKKAEADVRELNSMLEARVRERTAELEETVRNLDSFAYSVAHDFRAPLRAVNGFSHALIEDYRGKTLDAEAEDYLRRMADGAQRMDTLIMDLLTYNRLTRSRVTLEPLQTEAVVVGVLEQHRELMRERKANVRLAENLPEVLGNYEMLSHALSNLLSNAIKFVAPGVQPQIRIWAETRGERVRLWMEDNGIGIALEFRERIFGIFQRLNPSDAFPGTGIGLSIARTAIGRMGGDVGVEANVPKGSRFWIELPRPNPAPTP